MPDTKTKSYGKDHLNRRSDQRNLLDRFEILERKLEAEGEQEEGNADLGQELDLVNVETVTPPYAVPK